VPQNVFHGLVEEQQRHFTTPVNTMNTITNEPRAKGCILWIFISFQAAWLWPVWHTQPAATAYTGEACSRCRRL